MNYFLHGTVTFGSLLMKSCSVVKLLIHSNDRLASMDKSVILIPSKLRVNFVMLTKLMGKAIDPYCSWYIYACLFVCLSDCLSVLDFVPDVL